VGGRAWPAAIDTGFNGDLELAQVLARVVGAQYEGAVVSVVADGREIFEDIYRVDFPFDGEVVAASATFAAVGEILIGTRLLQRHSLEIDFQARSVVIRRANGGVASST
jgi:predicted aspartyl protease